MPQNHDMIIQPKLKIIVPLNLRTSHRHLVEANWVPKFQRGFPTDKYPAGDELNKGIIQNTDHEIIRIRSRDIPRRVLWGYGDVGLVGSDCVEGRYNGEIPILSRFSYGRSWTDQKPRVEIVSLNEDSAQKVEDIKVGSIFQSEPQHTRMLKLFLESYGFKVTIEENDAGPEFHKQLLKEGRVGITEVAGSVPVLLETNSHYGVMVNESGRTVDDYGLRVLGKITDIDTLLIANPRSLNDELKSELILNLEKSLEDTYIKIQGEAESLGGIERVPII